MNSLMDEPCINLKEGIDLKDLKDPNSEGVVFEVEEEQQPLETERMNTYFDTEEIVRNLYQPDDSSSCDDDEDDDRSPFERRMSKMEDITEEHNGRVMKKVLTPGAGPVVPPNSLLKVHYNGYLELADEPFDSSRLRNCEERKRLGKGEMFIGFEIAVSSMKKGELSRFIIHPDYAYGKMGCPPRIPADAFLMYEIELLHFVEKDEVDDFYRMSPDDRRAVTFENICKVCKAEKAEAEEFYKNHMWRKALAKYLKACRVFEEYHLKNDEEEQYQQKQLLKIFTNIANCYVKCCEPKRALPFANRALEIDPKHVKAYFWKAKAHHSLANFDQARQNLVKAQKLSPSSAEIRTELIKLNKDFEQFKLKESSYCRKMFSSSIGETDELKEVKPNTQDETSACSEDFKQAFKARLDAFIKDKDIDQLPFPSYQLSVPEIEYMIATAEQMGLDTVQQGEGRFVNFSIKKKKK
ncbi:inactive peptidyl-prolyl cis-trans isomerase FKBP6-like [Gigantopelta aegis]|uniref:inactive peptidyl-prolyl cis-trans isomerase FKBP6-like n=1 Tax=Gigantopelta aegis TaxID=1735272 RepID=UPI001B88E2F7|nr:inactive peptidyl-prolyl cis-trans isomerase FKBP6-like [Gigantopelta aegis]